MSITIGEGEGSLGIVRCLCIYGFAAGLVKMSKIYLLYLKNKDDFNVYF